MVVAEAKDDPAEGALPTPEPVAPEPVGPAVAMLELGVKVTTITEPLLAGPGLLAETELLTTTELVTGVGVGNGTMMVDTMSEPL